MLKKNGEVSIEITDFTDAGEGIGHADGIPVFVRGAVIGDTVKAHITKVKSRLAYAKIVSITVPSSDRTDAPCAHADKCGGCQLQSYDYQAALRYKKKKVSDAMMRIGHFDEEMISSVLSDTVGMEDPFRYRNKAQYPAGTDENGKVVFGFYAPHSHRIVPVTDCLICSKDHKKILDAVKESMQIAGVEAYNEETGTGYVRHVLIRRTADSSKYLVCLVVNATEALSRFRDVVILQLTQFPAVSSISLNFNPNRTNVILGGRFENIYGPEYLEDRLSDLTFRISAGAFYQVNPRMTEHLYQAVVDAAALTGSETVWDLYCGIGTISLTLASHGAKEVFGVEVSEEAVRRAKENAKRNELANATFFAGDAAAVTIGDVGAPDVSDRSAQDAFVAFQSAIALPAPDVIVVDPPRKGCDEALLQTILSASPDRIIYVSCDAATLARDLRVLSDGGYEIKSIRPHDMFPFSVHVETITLLQKVSGR